MYSLFLSLSAVLFSALSLEDFHFKILPQSVRGVAIYARCITAFSLLRRIKATGGVRNIGYQMPACEISRNVCLTDASIEIVSCFGTAHWNL